MFFRLSIQCIHSLVNIAQKKSHPVVFTGCDFAVNYEL